MKSKDLDVVYTIKQYNNNHELRYSLRSLINLPHKDVWIVGHKPEWANVNHIPSDVIGKNKISNTNHNWLMVAMNKSISDPFILMNDDFFISNPVDSLEHGYLCSNKEFSDYYMNNHRDSYYTQVIINTTDRLSQLGIDDAMCYELHTPMIIYKKDIIKALDNHNYKSLPVNIRTLAASIGKYGGNKTNDVKVYLTVKEMNRSNRRFATNDFVSTDDRAFLSVSGRFIMQKFNKRCEYEK